MWPGVFLSVSHASQNLINEFSALITQNTEYSETMKGLELLTSGYVINELETSWDTVSPVLFSTGMKKGTNVILSSCSIACVQVQCVQAIGGTGKCFATEPCSCTHTGQSGNLGMCPSRSCCSHTAGAHPGTVTLVSFVSSQSLSSFISVSSSYGSGPFFIKRLRTG